MFKNVSIIIPSLDPTSDLEKVVHSVMEQGFCDIILVDDGSKEENKKFFPKGDGITLLVHEVNKGKGAALKTAMEYVVKNRPDSNGVVTCDGDGQHTAKDVANVCKKMLETDSFILGVRNFSGSDVPPKSRIGNRLSTLALALCCGSVIHDTQTGLRAIPSHLLKDMLKIEGSRFEYETNVLLALRSLNAKYFEVEIQTVYLNENKGTHFHPFKDTLRILSRILKYAASSCAAFLTDIILFFLLSSAAKLGVILSTVLARAVSSVVNFVLNKKLVFNSREPTFKALLKYYTLAVPVMLISAFGVKGLVLLLDIDASSPLVTVLKIIVDTVIFILNYQIQKKWIFKSNVKGNGNDR